MFQRIVGLDIGSHSIKTVLVQRGLKGPYLEKSFESPFVRLKGNGNEGPLHEKLSEVLVRIGARSASGKTGRELLVASVPQRAGFTRLIRLPFANPQQVAQTVGYEMEGQIPLDLEEVIVDYHPIHISASAGGTTEKDSTVLAFALPKEFLKRQLETFQKAGADPKAFEIDSLALFNFYQHYLSDSEKDLALLDIGASKTSICVVGEGKPRMIRTVWIGGNHLTQALAQASGLSFDQAEQEKINTLLSDLDTDSRDFPQIIKGALVPLIKELTTTFHLYQMQSGREVRKIYVCGGTSRMQGLPSYLASQLGKDLALGPGIPDEGVFAVSLGLALKECLGQKASRIRFRTGEFSYRKERAEARRRLLVLGVTGAFLILLAGGNSYMRYYLKEAKYQELKSHVRGTFHQTFPGIKTIVDEVEQTKAAKKEVEKNVAFLGGGAVTVLDLLRELTRRVPGDRWIEVQDLLIEQDTIRLEAETDSFEGVEKFKELLGKYEGFREVTISDAKMSADQSKVRFRIQIGLNEGV